MNKRIKRIGVSEMTASNPTEWENLRNMILEMKRHYDSLHEILQKKEKELLSGNTKKLNKLIQEEQIFINKLEKQENKRLEAAAACIPGNSAPTLKDILEQAPEEEREPLENAALELIESLNDVVVANKNVAELVKVSMDFVNFQINLYGSCAAQENIYEGSGKIRQTEPGVKGIINTEA